MLPAGFGTNAGEGLELGTSAEWVLTHVPLLAKGYEPLDQGIQQFKSVIASGAGIALDFLGADYDYCFEKTLKCSMANYMATYWVGEEGGAGEGGGSSD